MAKWDAYDWKTLKRLEEKKWIVGECWRWLGRCNDDGYGRIRYGIKKEYTHRVAAYLFLDFDLDSDKQVLHKNFICKFRDCWNPEHLYISDKTRNMLDKSEANTHCPQGHEYNETNTNYSALSKHCRICDRERYWAKKGAEDGEKTKSE